MQSEKQGEAGSRVQATASAALSSWAGISMKLRMETEP